MFGHSAECCTESFQDDTSNELFIQIQVTGHLYSRFLRDHVLSDCHVFF